MRALNIIFVISNNDCYKKINSELSSLDISFSSIRIQKQSELFSQLNDKQNCLIVSDFSTCNSFSKNFNSIGNKGISDPLLIILDSKTSKVEIKKNIPFRNFCVIDKNDFHRLRSIIVLLNKNLNNNNFETADFECLDYLFKESKLFWDLLPVGLYRANSKGKIIRVNKALLKKLGFNSLSVFNKVNSLNKKNTNSIISQEFIKLLRDQDKINQYNSIWLHKSGSIVDFNEIVAAKKNKYDKIICIDGIVTDIINKRLNLNEAKKRDVEFTRIVELFSDSILVINEKGKILAFNKLSEKLFGYSGNDMIEMNFFQMIPQDYKDDFQNILKVFNSKYGTILDKTPIEIEAIKKDKTILNVAVSFSNWTIDNKLYFALIIRELLENNNVIDNFKQELDLFSSLTESYKSELITNNQILNNFSVKTTSKNLKENIFLRKTEVDTQLAELNDNKYLYSTFHEDQPLAIKLNSKTPKANYDINKIQSFNMEQVELLETNDIRQKQKLIIKILKEINSEKDFSESLNETLNILNEVFNFDALTIFLLENEAFVCKASLGLHEDVNKLSHLKHQPVGINKKNNDCYLKCLCGKELSLNEDESGSFHTSFGSYFTNDIKKVSDDSFNCLFSKEKQNLKCDNFSSIAVIPLSIDKNVIGCLRLFSKNKNAFSSSTIQFFEEISSIYSIAFKKNENQTQLEKSEKQFKQLYNNSTACLFRADVDGNILLANPSFISLLGFNSFEQIKKEKTISSLFSDKQDKDAFIKFLETKGDVSDFVTNWKRRDGSTIVVLESAKMIYDNNDKPIYYEGTVQDITKQKISERKLAESEKQFRLIWENSMDAMRLLDENGYIIEVNDAFCELVEKNRNELIGKYYFELYLNKDSLDQFKQFLSQSENQKHYEKEIILWNGKRKWVSVSNSLFNFSDDNKLLLSIYRDITVSKEQELDLKFFYNKVEESNRIKTEFLSQMSHEIRTPVNVLVSISRMMEEEIESNQNVKLNSFIKTVKSETTRIVNTFDTILNYAEINSGSYSPTFVELSLVEDIVKKSFEKHLGAMNDKNLDFIFNQESERSIITGDKYSLFYIFDQLFDNAVKFTLKGRISISILEEENKLLAIIEDTGIGISEDYLENLFKPFSQEDNGYSRKFDGSGLGLALVKKYCELNNIDINIYSIKNIGTTIILQFNSTINTEVLV